MSKIRRLICCCSLFSLLQRTQYGGFRGGYGGGYHTPYYNGYGYGVSIGSQPQSRLDDDTLCRAFSTDVPHRRCRALSLSFSTNRMATDTVDTAITTTEDMEVMVDTLPTTVTEDTACTDTVAVGSDTVAVVTGKHTPSTVTRRSDFRPQQESIHQHATHSQ